MKTVKFEDGTYGLRIGSWLMGYEFKDLTSKKHSWKIGDKFFDDCKGTYEDVEKILNPLKYKVIR